MNFYTILGVERNASQTQIKKAYHELIRKYHPDTNPDAPDAEDRCKQINQAYEVLMDTDKRTEYDRSGSVSVSEKSKNRQPPPAGMYDPNFDPGLHCMARMFQYLKTSGRYPFDTSDEK